MRTINKWIALTIVLPALMVTPAMVFTQTSGNQAIIDTTVDYSKMCPSGGRAQRKICGVVRTVPADPCRGFAIEVARARSHP